MRVGFNARYLREFNLRGFNRYTISLLKALKRRTELELVLFTDNRSPIHPAFVDELNLDTVSINSRRTLFWEQIRLPIELRRRRIDLFHAPADGGLPVWKTCPLVITHHRALDKSLKHWIRTGELHGRIRDYLPEQVAWRRAYLHCRHSLLRFLYLRSANKIITVSNFAKWELVELLGVSEDKVVVIYEAADERFSNRIDDSVVRLVQERLRIPSRYLLFVGGFDPWKNVPGLLRAYVCARSAGVQEPLVLVGTGGDLSQVRDSAKRLGLQVGRDLFILERIHEDLPALYRGATAFVSVSWGESFGLPFVEAMSSGTPIVASNRGAIPEVLQDAAILVDPRNNVEVATAIRLLTGRVDLQVQLRAKGLERASQFSWDTAAEQTIGVYEQVLEARLKTKDRT